jgi:hypothetical protein
MRRALLAVVVLVTASATAAGCSTRDPSAVRLFPVSAPVQSPAKRPAPRADLEAPLAKLRGTRDVGGAAVGIDGTESTFYQVGAAVLPGADPSLRAWLLADDDATLRSLGLRAAALARDGAVLMARACDRDPVLVCPGGCVCWDVDVGQIAQSLAVDPTWLEAASGQGSPLLGAAAVHTLEVQLAAIDGCRTAGELADHGDALGRSPWTWKALRGSTSLPAWMIVKAIARHGRDKAAPELSRILGDTSLPAEARLAAASGLARYGGAGAETALEQHRWFLRGQGHIIPSRFAEDVSARRKVAEIEDRLSLASSKDREEEEANAVIQASERPHPALLGLRQVPYLVASEKLDLAWRRAILSLARRFGDRRACWDLYRDTAYELEWALGRSFHSGLAATWKPEERDELTARVRAEVALLDADLRCRSY